MTTITDKDRKAAQTRTAKRGQAKSSPGVKAPRKPRAAKKQTDGRPYLLESSVVQMDVERHHNNAISQIEAIEANMLAIETEANQNIAHIRALADTELDAHRRRRDDLLKIIAMTSHALGRNAPQLPQDNNRLAMALQDQRDEAKGADDEHTYDWVADALDAGE